MAMTEREFLNAVLNSKDATEEMRTYATEGIAKLDARNDKRRNTLNKTQRENAEIMRAIVTLVTEKGAMVASAIASELEISTQKASALCKLLVDNKVFVVSDVKSKNKGTVKSYSLVPTETAE